MRFLTSRAWSSGDGTAKCAGPSPTDPEFSEWPPALDEAGVAVGREWFDLSSDEFRKNVEDAG
jgi:hypothetical protein